MAPTITWPASFVEYQTLGGARRKFWRAILQRLKALFSSLRRDILCHAPFLVAVFNGTFTDYMREMKSALGLSIISEHWNYDVHQKHPVKLLASLVDCIAWLTGRVFNGCCRVSFRGEPLVSRVQSLLWFVWFIVGSIVFIIIWNNVCYRSFWVDMIRSGLLRFDKGNYEWL